MCFSALLRRALALTVFGGYSATALSAATPDPGPPQPIALSPGQGGPESAPAEAATPPWDAPRLAALTAKLADERFAVREAASKELSAAPARFLGAVRAAAGQADEPEIRKRLHEAARAIFTGQVVRQLPEWQKPHGFLGIRWTISGDPPGVLVQDVIPETTAGQAGLQAGDTIIQVDDKIFPAGLTHEDAMLVWRTMLPGDAMVLKVQRPAAAEPIAVKLVVGEPSEQYRRPDTDADKEQQLWARYLDGKITIPASVQNGTAPEPGRGSSVGAARRKPLQSWPPELEAPDAPR